jgi:two-component system chemotaxis response regulator CheB
MIKVLIVDDSALVRKILSDELSKYEDIQIVDTAMDPYIAREKIVKHRPDVITLDLEMPRMDGLSFLEKLMNFYPMPGVILSSLAPKNSVNALKALELGAVEVICKPGSAYSTHDVSRQLVHAIRLAASVKIQKPVPITIPPAEEKPVSRLLTQTTDKVIAIGASTGGTKAIELVLSTMPVDAPGIVIVQHMPEHFTATFSERLNSISPIEVREAKNNDNVVPGLALIAPGNHHMVLHRSGAKYLVKIKTARGSIFKDPVWMFCFNRSRSRPGKRHRSFAYRHGRRRRQRSFDHAESGAYTFAQDEASSVVFGMPREAIKLGAVEEVVSLTSMTQAVVNAVRFEKKPKKIKKEKRN